MEIIDVKAVGLNKKFEVPFKGGTYQHNERGTILTRISTRDGVVGQAYVGQNRTKIDEQQIMCDIINKTLKKELVGKDPISIENLWKSMLLNKGVLQRSP